MNTDANRVLLVTGGSRGIGAAVALLAAQRGYAVAVNYHRDAAAAQAVVQRIAAGGGKALAVQGDVADIAAAGFNVCPEQLRVRAS